MKFRIGLDIHGVLDKNFEQYLKLVDVIASSETWDGCEIHIITGIKEDLGLIDNPEIAKIGYGKWFSIHEECERLGVDINFDSKGRPLVDPEIWDKQKALYCERNKIDFMIDDSPVYGKYFTGHTIYLQQQNLERDNWRHDNV